MQDTFLKAFRELNSVQLSVLKTLSKHKKVALMLPRQIGKTHFGIWCLREVLAQDSNAQSIFLAKDFPSVQRATKDKFLKLFDPGQFKVSAVSGIQYPNPSQHARRGQIFLSGIDKSPDKIRGGTMAMIHWSEAAFSNFEKGVTFDNALQRIFMPMLTRTKGMFLIETTPNGKNEFYNFWEDAENLGFKKIHFPVELCIQLGTITRDEVDSICTSMHPNVVDQEVHCKFVSFAGKIYGEYRPGIHNQIIEPKPTDYVVGSVDFGFSGSNTTALFSLIRNGMQYVFDQVYIEGKRYDELAHKIKMRLEYYDIPIENAVFYCDHDSDMIEDLQNHGISCVKVDKRDRFASRMTVKEEFYFRRLYINPLRCDYLIKEVSSAVWDEKKMNEMNESGDPNRGHWDSEAALRYLVRGGKVEREDNSNKEELRKRDSRVYENAIIKEQRKKLPYLG